MHPDAVAGGTLDPYWRPRDIAGGFGLRGGKFARAKGRTSLLRIAHLSDTHLGFRAYSRTTPDGFNQREVDVLASFQQCLDAIAAKEPDLVVHAGDFFHVVRPSNATIVASHRALSAFQRSRDYAPFVLIGGNHDTPRVSDSGNILSLLATIPGVRLAADRVDVVDLPELDAEVVCLPSLALRAGEPIPQGPTGKRSYSVLALHGLARQVFAPTAEFDVAHTHPDRWTYVALGDYHIFQSYGPNVSYAGSTDFTSTNIWEESARPKGWVWFDADAAKLEMIPLETRAVIDLPTIDVAGLDPEEIEARLERAATWDPASQPIVRQRIVNAQPGLRGKLRPSVLRELGAACLNYLLHPIAGASPTASREGRVTPGSVDEYWLQRAGERAYPAGISPQDVARKGLELLKEVAEREAAPAATV